MTDDSGIRKDVFAWFGAAAYAAQCFEVELCILLLLVRRLKNPSATPQELDELNDRLSKKTLGALLRKLGKHLEIHPDFKAMLDGYLDKRNYLMHHFFSDHSTYLLTRNGCQKMIDELKEYHTALKEADSIAQTMSKNMRKHLGISEDDIQALVQTKLHGFVDE